ncbi:MAG: hypothetical protein GYB67_01265 [Chloroflexi bacterium]|nr:hypothetical protein [Chloroflexota bacterium]
MPVTYVKGDPLLTRAQILAFGHNARGRPEQSPLALALQQRYPAAFASYTRQCRQGRIQPGMFWRWSEARPTLGFMVVRESPVGATRLRFVDTVVLLLARDHRREAIGSVALTPPGSSDEWPQHRELIERWLAASALPVVVYTTYQPGVTAAEPFDPPTDPSERRRDEDDEGEIGGDL